MSVLLFNVIIKLKSVFVGILCVCEDRRGFGRVLFRPRASVSFSSGSFLQNAVTLASSFLLLLFFASSRGRRFPGARSPVARSPGPHELRREFRESSVAPLVRPGPLRFHSTWLSPLRSKARSLCRYLEQ